MTKKKLCGRLTSRNTQCRNPLPPGKSWCGRCAGVKAAAEDAGGQAAAEAAADACGHSVTGAASEPIVVAHDAPDAAEAVAAARRAIESGGYDSRVTLRLNDTMVEAVECMSGPMPCGGHHHNSHASEPLEPPGTGYRCFICKVDVLTGNRDAQPNGIDDSQADEHDTDRRPCSGPPTDHDGNPHTAECIDEWSSYATDSSPGSCTCSCGHCGRPTGDAQSDGADDVCASCDKYVTGSYRQPWIAAEIQALNEKIRDGADPEDVLDDMIGQIDDREPAPLQGLVDEDREWALELIDEHGCLPDEFIDHIRDVDLA